MDKVGICFIPLLFAGQWLVPGAWFCAGIAFVSFSCIASAGYIFNDLVDRANDALHPLKKHRPLALGRISIRVGILVAIILFLGALLSATFLGYKNVLIVLSYAVAMFLYSRFLKRVPIIDLCIISFGFVLRILAGAAAIQGRVSWWLVTSTISMAFLLGLGKRISEAHYIKGISTRPTLGFYTRERTICLERVFSAIALGLYADYVFHTHPNVYMRH